MKASTSPNHWPLGAKKTEGDWPMHNSRAHNTCTSSSFIEDGVNNLHEGPNLARHHRPTLWNQYWLHSDPMGREYYTLRQDEELAKLKKRLIFPATFETGVSANSLPHSPPAQSHSSPNTRIIPIAKVWWHCFRKKCSLEMIKMMVMSMKAIIGTIQTRQLFLPHVDWWFIRWRNTRHSNLGEKSVEAKEVAAILNRLLIKLPSTFDFATWHVIMLLTYPTLVAK